MVKVLDHDIVVSEFKHQLHYSVDFQIILLEKIWILIYPISYDLNIIIAILLQGQLKHLISHKGWYAIKQRNHL